MDDCQTCGFHVKGINVFIGSPNIVNRETVRGNCRCVQTVARNTGTPQQQKISDTHRWKFNDVYFVVLGLTLWADCALELGQAHQHTVVAGSAL